MNVGGDPRTGRPVQRGRLLGALVLSLMLSLGGMVGCGGSDDPSGPSDTATVGTQGGELAHVDGVRLTVPQGALSQALTLHVARDTTGMNAALLGGRPNPSKSVDLSPTYALTPHGTHFSTPVELRIPLDAAVAKGPGVLVVLRTEPGRGSWDMVPVDKVENGAAVVTIDGFSYYKAVRVVQMPGMPATGPQVPTMTATLGGVGPEDYTVPGINPSPGHRRLYGEITSRSQTLRYAGRLEGVPATCATITLNGKHRYPKLARAEDAVAGQYGPGYDAEFARTNATIGSTVVNGLARTTLDFGFDLNIDNAPFKTDVFQDLRGNSNTGPTPTVAVSFNAWAECSTAFDLGGGNVVNRLRVTPGVQRATVDPAYPDWVSMDDKGWAWVTVQYKVDYLPQGFIDHPQDVTAPTGTSASFSTSAWPTPVGEQRIEWWRSNNEGGSWTRVRTSIVPTTDTTDTLTLPSVTATDHNTLLRARLCTTPRLADVAESCTDGLPARLSVVQGVTAATFTQQPRAVLVRTGQTASVSVQVSGAPTPTVRWQSRPANSTGAWADVASGTGGATVNYSTAVLALADNGLQLRAVASNLAGDVPSVPVTVSVSDQDVAPSVLTQPASLSVVAGSEAVFAVVARGTEALSYQWRRNGQPISGANAPLLKLTNVDNSDASVYSVQVSNAVGNVVSADATLQVSAAVAPAVAPSIVTPPAAVKVNSGNTVTFAVGAAGTGPLSYQWYRNGQPVSGATAAYHSFAATSDDNGASFSVLVRNEVGSVTSTAAPLTVLADAQPTAVSITTQPSAQVQLPGGSATFAVAASGTGPLSYQWRKAGTPLAGATTAVLVLNNVSGSDAAAYSVTVTNALGSVTSDAASLTVVGAPAITTAPSATSVVEGNTASFTVAASGSSLRYQWLRNGVAIGGATSAGYTTAALGLADNGAEYGVVVYNGAGVVISPSVLLTVTAAPVQNTAPLVLATNSSSNTLSVLRADAVTGELTSLGSVNTGSYPYKVVISPNGRFAFVSNVVSATLQPFSVDTAAGTVTAGAARSTTNPYGVAVDPLNRFVWVANYAAGGTVSTFLIDATTGALTPSGSPVSTGGTYPYAVAAHPSGNFIFVVNEAGGNVAAYTVNASTGVPTLVGTFGALASPQSLVVAPDGQRLFVAEAGNNRVSSFAINTTTGVLTPSASVYVSGASAPAGIAIHPGGRVLYVANANSNNVGLLSVSATGALANLGTPVAAGSGPQGLALNSAGTRLYVVNGGGNSVSTFSVNAQGDTIAALGSATATGGSLPTGIAVSP